SKPIGTGAYVFESRIPRQEVRWSLNTKYFRPRPQISRIKLVVIPDESTGALALRKGDVHAQKVQDPGVFRSLRGDAYVQVAADQWRQIGVTAKIRVIESGAFAALASAPEHNFQAIAGGIGRPTSEQQLVQFNSRSPRLNNYATYKNEKVDGIIDQLAL